MGKPEGVNRVVPGGPHISQEQYKKLFENPVSAEALKRQDAQRDRMVSIQKAERVSRRAEARQLRTFEMALGISAVRPEAKPSLLSEEQKQVIKTAILESGKKDEDQKAMFETLMGSTKDQEMFVALHDKWLDEWKADPVLQGKQSFNEYVNEKGLQYIKEYAREMRMTKGDIIFDENREKTGLTEEQLNQEREKFRKALDMYFQANGVALAELNSLDETEKVAQKKILLDKFVMLMGENGMDKMDKAKMEEIFNFYVESFEYEYAAYEEWNATYEEMILMASLGLTPEEWELRRQKALKKNAKGELQEYLQQQTTVTFTSGNDVSAPSVYREINAFGNTFGVHFNESPGEKNVWRINAPAVDDRSFSPRMTVVFEPPDSKIVNSSTRFVVEQIWQDEDSSGKGRVIAGREDRLTREYKPEDMIGAVNRAILDHVINSKINKTLTENAKQGTNRLIREELMVHLAERLLVPFRVGDRAIKEEEINSFQRFMEVVLRKDDKKEYGSLQERIFKARTLVDRDGDLGYLQEMFSKPGAKVRTLSELEEEIALRRRGEKNNKKNNNMSPGTGIGTTSIGRF